MARVARPARLAPEADAALLAAHRLDAPLEVIGWLRQLRERGVDIDLFTSLSPTPFRTRLLAANAPVDRMVFAADGLAVLGQAGGEARATAVAFIDQVKLQFPAGPFTPAVEAGRDALVSPLPAALHRLQRRDAFRVTPPAPRAARCALDARDVHAPTHPVSDLSVGGMSVVLPSQAHASLPSPGTRWNDCLLELPGVAALRCAVVLMHAEALGAGAGVRLGLRFQGLDAQAERDVQRYVIAAQRVRRSCS